MCLNSQKLSHHHLRSLIYRKHLQIITITLVIIFCIVLLSDQFRKSFKIFNVITIDYETMSNTSQEAQQQQEQSIEVFSNRYEHSAHSSIGIKLKNILNCIDIPLQMEIVQHGEYWMLKNYIRGRKCINMRCADSITYTTNGDYTFMGNLETVVKRWLAPISFTIYAPGYDYNATMDSILYVLNCLSESQLIRDYVTFHIYFHKDHMPPYIATNETEALKWPYNCKVDVITHARRNRSEMYKAKNNLTYPINVARNLARKTANTYFVFPCDIELYPSLGLVDQFLKMVLKNSSMILEDDKPKVFPLAVFEVEKNASLPDTKKALKEMLNNSMAVPFHKYVCSNCHLLPKQNQWIEADDTNELEIFTVAKRYGKFAMWEPFYISNNKEPIFDERVTWEGQSNKRIQNYAMCLMDYEYHILHPAFLVHSPGIKRLNIKSKETKNRFKYAAAMYNVIHNEIEPEYSILYGENKYCKV